MKQLTWLAAEQRLCTDGDSEEEHSPTSPGSQEEEEEEEEGPKGEDSGEGRSKKAGLDEETPSRERTPGGVGGRCPGRGRGGSASEHRLKHSPSVTQYFVFLIFCHLCRPKPTSSWPQEEPSGAPQQRWRQTAAAV